DHAELHQAGIGHQEHVVPSAFGGELANPAGRALAEDDAAYGVERERAGRLCHLASLPSLGTALHQQWSHENLRKDDAPRPISCEGCSIPNGIEAVGTTAARHR